MANLQTDITTFKNLLNLAYPVLGGAKYGASPANLVAWLGNHTPQEIMADMDPILAAIPAPPGDVAKDGGNTFKRATLWSHEMSTENWDTYYANGGTKPSVQETLDRVLTTNAVNPPAPVAAPTDAQAKLDAIRKILAGG